ncbi:MAG: terpene cyclase/mutase family protein [Candidatus Helarchaeota archaeon]|nr:terpene cyclase/mutase family protein [Candidatus Helarchaeota archaeon]
MPSLQAITQRKDALIGYVKSCDTGAGFALTPGGSEPKVEHTFQALYILEVFNELGDIDEESLIEFVNNCKNVDYGFGNTEGADSDIYSTYYACWIFDLFNVEMYNYTYEWVIACQNGSAGFGEKINESEYLYPTYYGLEALTINGTDLSDNDVSVWLLERQNTNPSSDDYGGFATDGNSSNMWSTWAAIGSLSRLDNISQVLTEPLVSWINSSQNLNVYEDDYGAFSRKPIESDYCLHYTYTAIYSLRKLGTTYLSRINLGAALDWLLNLQNDDGGFRTKSADSDSSLSLTYYAFSILNLLGERGRLDTDVPWEYGFELPLWLWFLIGVAIVLTAILLIKKYYID